MIEDLNENIFIKMAENLKEKLIYRRRDFHKNPELGFQLDRTSAQVENFLKEEGIEYYKTAQSGICAIIRGNGSKTIAVRADMDALPLMDMKHCEYSSKISGRMHACGHDAHTTILMGTASILNSIKKELKGNVKLFFEPAEETVGGARNMVEEGVLHNPEVDAVIGLHVDEHIEVGNIGLKRGVVNAASNPFKMKVSGRGGHGAHPDDCIDPIYISSNIIMSLQSIISREIPPTDPAVITIGSIQGGTAQNIIPEEVNISGIIRTMRPEHREYVKRRVKEISEGIAVSMRGKCNLDIDEGYPCLYNDDKMFELLQNSAASVIGKEKIIMLDNPSMGVESFAYFSMEKPAVFYYLGCRNSEKGIVHPAHSSFFDIDEDCLPIGVAIQCKTVWDFLNKGME